MKTFKLVTKKSEETITVFQAETLEGAVLYFAKIKNLTVEMLLSIYNVTIG